MAVQVLDDDHDLASSIGELYCVRQEVENDLLESFPIRLDKERVVKASEMCLNLNIFEMTFVTKDILDFLNCFCDVESRFVFAEVLRVLVEYRIVEDVMDEEVYEFAGGAHFVTAVLKASGDFLQLLFNNRVLFKFVNNGSKTFKDIFHGDHLAD